MAYLYLTLIAWLSIGIGNAIGICSWMKDDPELFHKYFKSTNEIKQVLTNCIILGPYLYYLIYKGFKEQ